MARSGSALAVRQLWKTVITSSDVLLKSALNMALKEIRGTIAETRSSAGPILWHGLKHWLSNTSEPLSIDTSRYSGRTQFLVQQAPAEQERIGWDKAFRGYVSIAWGLLEAPHEVDSPYNKTPHHNPTRGWAILTLTNLGTFSKAMRIDRNQKLHDPTNTSSPTSRS